LYTLTVDRSIYRVAHGGGGREDVLRHVKGGGIVRAREMSGEYVRWWKCPGVNVRIHASAARSWRVGLR